MTEASIRGWGIAAMDLTMLVFRRLWKTLGLWARKSDECFKHGITGHPSRSLEDNSAESCMDYRGLDEEVIEGNISICARILFCDILAKYVVVFCPCPKNLPEVKLKSFELISLAEISKQPSIDC